jgi:tRNA(Arg) A34 adenosine deaminase TadA
MAGNEDYLVDKLIEYARNHLNLPYISFVVKSNVIVSIGYNQTYEKLDETLHGDVVAIRKAQASLETGDLSGYSLYSLFEPTILSFDVALWAGIRDFVWCINSSTVPNHYNNPKYSPLVYAGDHPGEITIRNGIRESEVLEIVNKTKAYKRFIK